ncbi:hypothetical protein BH09MYX1_BH09MYX1_14590 [soil metagenome]
MFTRGAAIRPVPSFAVVDRKNIDDVEAELTETEDGAEARLDAAFRRFESSQPALADRMNRLLSRPLDDTALALGYFLGIAIYLAFERQFGAQLHATDETAIMAIEQSITLEEELRAARSTEPLEVEDVVAHEQPAVVAFLHEHVEAALDLGEEGVTEGREVDVDDVHTVYRTMLLLTLSLSHAIEPRPGVAQRSGELLA